MRRLVAIVLGVALALPARAASGPPATPAAPAAPGAPRVVATVSKTEVSVGERFTVDVKASGPAGTAFAFPGDAVQESFELRTAPETAAAARPDEAGGKAGVPSPPPPGTYRYQAAVFTIGEAEIPPIPVRYRLPDGTEGEVSTDAIPLRVVSLLPKEKEQQKLADVRGPLALSIGRAFWIGLALLVLLAGGLAWWLVSRRRAKAPAAAASIPVVEADIEARLALDALIASGRIARGEYRPFYIELTAIAKRYLERRLGAPIVEMTTAETLAHLRTTPVAADQAPFVRDLTGAADRIKFAQGSGLLEESERHLASTRRLIDEVEQRLRPPAPEGGRAA